MCVYYSSRLIKLDYYFKFWLQLILEWFLPSIFIRKFLNEKLFDFDEVSLKFFSLYCFEFIEDYLKFAGILLKFPIDCPNPGSLIFDVLLC